MQTTERERNDHALLVRVPDSLYVWLAAEAGQRGLSVAAYVRQVLFTVRERSPKP